MHLTQQNCERATVTNGKPQQTYPDDHKASREAVAGLALRVNPRGKSWVFLRSFNGRRYRTLGTFAAMDLEKARRMAREWAGMMDKGIDPQGVAPAALAEGGFDPKMFTVAQGFDCYANWLRENGKSPRTIKLVDGEKSEAHRRWKEFLRRPLVSVRKAECKALHKAIKRGLGGNPDDGDCTKGSGSANRACRLFQSMFSRVSAEKGDDGFPKDAANPIRKGFGWFAEESRDGKVLWAELPAWWAETETLSPIRRDAWRLLLFTGLRNTDATSIRWDHVDLPTGTLHRPSPKGGKRKAFTIPLSSAALAILRTRKRDNAKDHGRDDEGWVFPTVSLNPATRGKTVCIQKLRENVYTDDGQRVTRTALKRPHDIRRTFQNAARKAGVSEYDYKVLMNHGRPRKAGSQSEQYNVAEIEDLRNDTQRLTDFLLAKIGVAVVDSQFVKAEPATSPAATPADDDLAELLKQRAVMEARITAALRAAADKTKAA